MRRIASIPLAFTAVLFLAVPSAADHPGQSGPFPHVTHLEVKGSVVKIHPSMLVIQIPYGLRPRTISIAKAERIGLHDVTVGEEVTLVLDEGNVLVDAHKTRLPGHGHRIIAGEIDYADPYWSEMKLSTPEGTEQFEVDPLAGSKLSVFSEGTPVEVELDEANVVIDIHRRR